MVVLVFDEFPADDLLGPDGQIDAERFPNFAELASMSTWFPNGHTVYDSTFKAVPVDPRRQAAQARNRAGRAQPQAERLPRDGPARLRGLQGRVGVRRVPARTSAPARGPAGPACSRASPGAGARRASTTGSGAIRERPQPSFYFQHALMPHEPWLYLPSGRQSRPAGNDPVEGINKLPGFDDPDLSVHNHLRHLLQVGYTDHLVGELLDAAAANRPAAPRPRSS